MCLACLLVAGAASAEPAPWSIELSPQWSDITADTAKLPGLVALKQDVTRTGGTFELRAYANGQGQTIVGLTSDIASIPSKMSELVAFENAARGRSNQGGTEVSYRADRTETTLDTTQRVGGKAAPIVGRRVTGVLRTGGLRSVSVICYGDPAVCDPLLATLSIDTAPFRLLASLGQGDDSMTYRVGVFTGSVLVVILIVAFAWRRRTA